jgi:hypothetical protein
MRFAYSFVDVARQRGDGLCVSVGSAGLTEAGALWASKEENVVCKKAVIDRQSKQAGDVPKLGQMVSKAGRLLGYKPTISFKDGGHFFSRLVEGAIVVTLS